MKFCKFCKFSALLMMIFSIKVFCFETPRPTKNFYVNDFANVLTSETQEKIMQNSRFLVEKMQAQLVVATIVSLENMALQEYSIKLARDWKIGGESLNNGALILLAPNERKIIV